MCQLINPLCSSFSVSATVAWIALKFVAHACSSDRRDPADQLMVPQRFPLMSRAKQTYTPTTKVLYVGLGKLKVLMSMH